MSNKDGLLITNEDLHKILSYLQHTVIPDDEGISKQGRNNLYDAREDLEWTIADHLGYDVNLGGVEPKNFTYIED